MLRERLLGALLGLPMLLFLIGLNWYLRAHGNPDALPLLIIVLIITGVSGWEVAHIVRQRPLPVSQWNGVYAAMIIPFMVHAVQLTMVNGKFLPTGSLGLLIDSLGATAAVMLLFLGVWGDVEHHGRPALRGNLIIIGAGLYLGGTLSTLLLLGSSPYQEIAVLFIFFAVFALDTAAYFGGKQFGGVHLAPRVSPSKTMSGALCGLAGTVLVAMLFKIVFVAWTGAGSATPWWQSNSHLSWGQLAIIGIGVGIFGQLGDLVESAFKRWGGVKDSGTAIRGHGGFLDRFDSLMLAAPIGYLLLTCFLHFMR